MVKRSFSEISGYIYIKDKVQIKKIKLVHISTTPTDNSALIKKVK